MEKTPTSSPLSEGASEVCSTNLLEVSRQLECQLPTEVTCLCDTPWVTSYPSLSHSPTPLLGFLGSPPMLTIVCKSLSQDILGNPAKVWSVAKPSITLFFARRPLCFPLSYNFHFHSPPSVMKIFLTPLTSLSSFSGSYKALSLIFFLWLLYFANFDLYLHNLHWYSINSPCRSLLIRYFLFLFLSLSPVPVSSSQLCRGWDWLSYRTSWWGLSLYTFLCVPIFCLGASL